MMTSSLVSVYWLTFAAPVGWNKWHLHSSFWRWLHFDQKQSLPGPWTWAEMSSGRTRAKSPLPRIQTERGQQMHLLLQMFYELPESPMCPREPLVAPRVINPLITKEVNVLTHVIGCQGLYGCFDRLRPRTESCYTVWILTCFCWCPPPPPSLAS